MLPPEFIAKAKEDALKKLHEAEYKIAMEAELARLKAKKLHFFPKKLTFQWPIKLVDWCAPS